MATPLPPELYDAVIDHLFADKRALGNCALVSSQFLPRSRYHLFREVFLKPGEPGHARHMSFLALLQSPFVTFPAYVRNLLLMDGDQTTWINKGLEVLQGFVSVECLDLCAVRWGDLSAGALATLRTFPVLKHLSLRYCTFDNFDQVVDIVCSHSGTLHSLRFSQSSLGPDCLTFTSLPPPPPLRLLKVDYVNENIAKWLFYHHACSSIQSLHLVVWCSISSEKYRILKYFGPSLLHLKVTLITEVDGGAFGWFGLNPTF
jgi:hypothetical protein